MGHAYQLVAVGTDGSPPSLAAVQRAAQLAAASQARLLIICAYRRDDRADTTTGASRPGATQAPGSEETEHALDEDSRYLVVGANPAEDVLRRAQQQAATVGVAEVQTLAVPGEPAGSVVEAARAQQADVVVVGNRGLNTLHGRLLGSVPQSISRQFAGDVLIVHTT